MALVVSNPEIERIVSLSKDVCFFSKKKIRSKGGIFDGLEDSLPLSRITVYQSGANRIQRKPDTNPPENKLERKKHDIYQFSYGARRRFFDYVNSLDFTNFYVYRFDFTLSTRIESFIKIRKYSRKFTYRCPYTDSFKTGRTIKEINDLFFIRKKLLRYLTKRGFDGVYKIEYTAAEVPHFHTIVWTKNKINICKEHTYRDEFVQTGTDFTDIVFNVLNLWNGNSLTGDLLSVYNDMCASSVSFSIPMDAEELRKKIFYLSFYFTKDKNYQNFIPEKYLGIKMWGKFNENYSIKEKLEGTNKTIRKNALLCEPTIIPINQTIYDKLYEVVRKDVESSKRKACKNRSMENCEVCTHNLCRRFHKKNGFFTVRLDEYYNNLVDNNHFNSMLSELEFQKIVDSLNI